MALHKFRWCVRRKGQRFLLLHSYRDGRGKVRQRRLGDFHDASGLERQLAGLSQSCPELTADLAQLRTRAECMLATAEPAWQRTPAQKIDKIRRATRTLLTLLAEEEDPDVLGQVAADLGSLQSRLNLPGNDRNEGGDDEDVLGPFWPAVDGGGRRFILAICDQHLVRRRLRIAKEQRVAVRNLVPDQSKGWLLQRGLAAAYQSVDESTASNIT